METAVLEISWSSVYDHLHLGDEERKADVSLWNILPRVVYDYVTLKRKRSKTDTLCLFWNVRRIGDNLALVGKTPATHAVEPIPIRKGN